MKEFAASRRECLLYTLAIIVFLSITSVTAIDIPQIRQRGWEAMCLRDDQPINFCSSFPGRREIAYSADLAATIARIDGEVNSGNRYQSDMRAYGVSDYWTVPMRGTADCEDYVLGKMLGLYLAGITLSATVIILGRLSNGRWHSILLVRTDRGSLVMDSLLPSQGSGFGAEFYLDMADTSRWRIAH